MAIFLKWKILEVEILIIVSGYKIIQKDHAKYTLGKKNTRVYTFHQILHIFNFVMMSDEGKEFHLIQVAT